MTARDRSRHVTFSEMGEYVLAESFSPLGVTSSDDNTNALYANSSDAAAFKKPRGDTDTANSHSTNGEFSSHDNGWTVTDTEGNP